MLSLDAVSQSADFYYLFNNKKEHLTQITGKYVVEFPASIPANSPLVSQNILLEKITDNLWYSFSPSQIANYTTNYVVHPAYINSAAAEIVFYNRVVLAFKENVTELEKTSLISNFNLTTDLTSTSFQRFKVNGDALILSHDIYETGLVKFCTPDFLANVTTTSIPPNDEYFDRQWYLHNTGQGTNDGLSTTPDADIDALEAWDISTGSSSIVIAVIDKGVTYDHMDLPANRQVIINGSNFDQGSVPSTNFPGIPSPDLLGGQDVNHGNACAGIIAATQNNNIGIAGIAPECKIMPIKGPFFVNNIWANWAATIDFAVNNGAKIISWSLGSQAPGTVPVMVNAIVNAINHNVLPVVSVGNQADHVSNSNGFVVFPGSEEIEGMISVSASDKNNYQANYSPSGYMIDIAAPSCTETSGIIPGESYNIWTIDCPGPYGYNPWDIAGYPIPTVGEVLPITGANHLDFTGRFGGVSAAVPQIAGVAALMLDKNSCLSPFQLQDIMQSTADKIGTVDYYWNPIQKPGHSQEFGYGKVNAYKAVFGAQQAFSSTIDLFTKDEITDIGVVGPNGTGVNGDKSPDIWVRNQQDGLVNQFSEQLEYVNPTTPCYVYVRVRNKSCATSAGTEKLYLYWTQASSWNSWPANWLGPPCTGGNIGIVTLPQIDPGGYTIVMMPWQLQAPGSCGNWNSCLLSRIEDGQTIIITPNQLNLDVIENNNISIRNVTIVDNLSPPSIPPAVLVGNILGDASAIDLHLDVPHLDKGFAHNITQEAEVVLQLDQVGWDLFNNSGQFNQSGIRVLRENAIQITEPNISFTNIPFPPNLRVPISFKFNFLIDEQTPAINYEYALTQCLHAQPNVVLGTETFEITKNIRSRFEADAGADKYLRDNETTTLEASDILESAIYNWYDETGELVHTGMSFSPAPAIYQKYILEVISNIDRFKDYDEVEVKQKLSYITLMYPNPCDAEIDISYTIDDISNAKIVLTKPFTNLNQVYTLDSFTSTATVNTANLPIGVYNIALYVNNRLQDIKSIQVIH